MLILEGAQAGLSWSTILKRREGYRKTFFHFDISRCAGMTDEEAYALLATDGMLVKRPIIVTDNAVLTGFKEAAWEEALL